MAESEMLHTRSSIDSATSFRSAVTLGAAIELGAAIRLNLCQLFQGGGEHSIEAAPGFVVALSQSSELHKDQSAIDGGKCFTGAYPALRLQLCGAIISGLPCSFRIFPSRLQKTLPASYSWLHFSPDQPNSIVAVCRRATLGCSNAVTVVNLRSQRRPSHAPCLCCLPEIQAIAMQGHATLTGRGSPSFRKLVILTSCLALQ